MILIAQYSVISHLTHTHAVYAHICTHTQTHNSLLPRHLHTSYPHAPRATHTFRHTHPHSSPLRLFVFTSHPCFLLNLHSYQSLYCFCSIVLGKVICHDLCGHRNFFSPRMGCLDGAFCVRTAGAASIFAAALSVYESSRYCTPWRKRGELCRLHTVKNEHCMILQNGCQLVPHRVFVQLTSWLCHVSVVSIINTEYAQSKT